MNCVIDRIRRAASHLLAYPFRVWGFGEGIGIRALLEASAATQDSQYEAFVRGLFSAWLGRGAAKTFEDHVAPGYELLALISERVMRRSSTRRAALPPCSRVSKSAMASFSTGPISRAGNGRSG